jgi:hypothetical protein
VGQSPQASTAARLTVPGWPTVYNLVAKEAGDSMSEYARPIEVTTSPELQRLAKQVQRTRQSVPLTEGDKVVAVVRPAPKRGARKPATGTTKRIPRSDSIFNIIGLGASEGPTDISENVDKYLAQAYYEEFHPPEE